jgi:hypothetical protein
VADLQTSLLPLLEITVLSGKRAILKHSLLFPSTLILVPSCWFLNIGSRKIDLSSAANLHQSGVHWYPGPASTVMTLSSGHFLISTVGEQMPRRFILCVSTAHHSPQFGNMIAGGSAHYLRVHFPDVSCLGDSSHQQYTRTCSLIGPMQTRVAPLMISERLGGSYCKAINESSSIDKSLLSSWLS